MSTATYADTEVAVNDEGFFTDPGQWSEEMAPQIAAAEGITELTGRFPGPVGLPLLKESRLNHLGKLGFQQFYWHMLLPGRDVPGLSKTRLTVGG